MKKEQLLIGALAGILLLVMAIPVPKSEEKEEMMIEEAAEIEPSIEQQLEEILQQISGVGRAEVLIIYEDDGKVILEKDESVSEELIQEADSSGGTRTTTTNRNERQTVYADGERPYVIQKISPTIEGVLVVAEGVGNTNVKNQIQQTIEALFGLDAHKISIMKMEVSK
jgi:stage III sporulation protein AG